MINLMKFCAKPGCGRDYLEAPSSRGDFTYATNGHIAVRVPRMPKIDENPDYPDVEKRIIEPIDWSQPFAPLLVDLGKKPRVQKCPECGRKRAPKWDDYCCLTCAGSREIDPEQYMAIDIDGTLFNRRYIRLIAELPNPELPERISEEFAPFKFAGGVGVLMALSWRGDPPVAPLVVPWPPAP